MATRRTDVLREAKAKSAELRDALKAKSNPEDHDVEFLRQSLRRLYLTVLFSDRSTRPSNAATQPSTGRLLDVLNLLWIETSHSFIHSHRQRIASLDKEVRQRAAAGTNSEDDGRRAKKSSSKTPGPVARRKLVHSLRSFLAAEESWWSSTIARIVETYDVRDAEPAVRALKISMAPLAPDDLPAEDDMLDPRQTLGRQQGLLLVHRALICFGDLARYRELYAESNNAAATAELAANAAMSRSYARSAECYHQARLLMPDDGNPSNQLAVLASYNQDVLSSIYHYYRALAVRNPFATARQNLGVTFNKALATSSAQDSTDVGASFVALHARLFLRKDLEVVPTLSGLCVGLLGDALPNRDLPSETIVKLIVLALAAWWDSRMQGSSETEALALSHVHAIMTVLLNFAADETVKCDERAADAAVEGEDLDALAMLIRPELRRALPALRIVSKWLLRHVEDARDVSALHTLWPAYVRCANAFADFFPLDSMPELPKDTSASSFFEEDVDTIGFLPLSQHHSMQNSSSPVRPAAPFTAGHPSQEHLLRVAGLVADQQLLAHGQGSPVAIIDAEFICVSPELAASFAASREAARKRGGNDAATFTPSPSRPLAALPPPPPPPVEHFMPSPAHLPTLNAPQHDAQSMNALPSANGLLGSASLGDEDDIVGEAFRAVSLGQTDDDNAYDDRVLFPSQQQQNGASSSSRPSPSAGPAPPLGPPTNAQDLLLRVLGDPSGGGGGAGGGASIWAPAPPQPQAQQQSSAASNIWGSTAATMMTTTTSSGHLPTPGSMQGPPPGFGGAPQQQQQHGFAPMPYGQPFVPHHHQHHQQQQQSTSSRPFGGYSQHHHQQQPFDPYSAYGHG